MCRTQHRSRMPCAQYECAVVRFVDLSSAPAASSSQVSTPSLGRSLPQTLRRSLRESLYPKVYPKASERGLLNRKYLRCFSGAHVKGVSHDIGTIGEIAKALLELRLTALKFGMFDAQLIARWRICGVH